MTGDGGQIVLEGAPVSTGREARVTAAGDYRFFAGWRSEPFFFDTQGALNDLQFTGTDFFAEADVCSIVLEVAQYSPRHEAAGPMGIAHWTAQVGNGFRRTGARGPRKLSSSAASKTVAIMAGEPVDDARFVAVFAHSLEHTGGYSREEANRVAATLLPDILAL